jgi:glyoxylase-like metal-dependent hydrolase (beta-lactamase superfamily II)
MLNVHSFTFNPFSENTYLLINEEKQCWVVDPGMYGTEEEHILIDYITTNELVPQAIINTHAHLDHIFGAQKLMDVYKIPFGVHQDETSVLELGTSSAALFGFDFPNIPKPTFYIKEGENLHLGKDELQVFHTPGHSPGSISLYNEAGRWAIAGDVLFSGSIGRTDLPGGDYDTLIRSIRTHLFPLPDHTVVYSGHGPATEISIEKKHNPFLQ